MIFSISSIPSLTSIGGYFCLKPYRESIKFGVTNQIINPGSDGERLDSACEVIKNINQYLLPRESFNTLRGIVIIEP